MRILVDTCVWADFFRGADTSESLSLARYLQMETDIATCGVVLAEFMQGVRDAKQAARLRPYFLAMDYLRPREPETYLAAADLFKALRKRGVTIRSTIDCLIACLAQEHDVLLLSSDRDMRFIIESDLLELGAAPLLDR